MQWETSDKLLFFKELTTEEVKVETNEQTKSQPNIVTVLQCQEKYSRLITGDKLQLAFHSYQHVSKSKGKGCCGAVRGEKWAFAWSVRLCSGIVQME